MLSTLTHFSRQKYRHVTNLINLSSSAALEERMYNFADERYYYPMVMTDLLDTILPSAGLRMKTVNLRAKVTITAFIFSDVN